ncbi:MAG: hypothetical protein JWN04_583, partial [Myxococcaceae bacterium]|nr:hypothetical protein [Myxococcaceae bacterium]
MLAVAGTVDVDAYGVHRESVERALQTRWVANADGAGVNVRRHSAHRRRHIAAACDGSAHDSGARVDHDPAAHAAWIKRRGGSPNRR